MTGEEKKKAIEQLQDLNNSGVISDQEFVDKVAQLEGKESIDAFTPSRGHEENLKGGTDGKGILAALFLIVCLVALFAFITGQGSKNSTVSYNRDSTQTSSLRTNSNETDSLIITIAQEFVKKELKSPSSAKFPWSNSEYTISKIKGNWVVKGYVDAQNSYGATIRMKFESCFSLEWVNGKDHSTKIYTLVYE